MKAYERLLKYVKICTTSDETTHTTPSTKSQYELAHILVSELQDIGVPDAAVDDNCYVYASIPASKGCENTIKIGFIAHMDTAPDFCGENVTPVIEENYDGSDIKLGSSGRWLKASDFPELTDLKGRTLIHTDGRTLLGADDKAGIAEIMTFAEEIMSSDEPHGKISIAFTPDEEIGEGTDHFDIERFGAEYAYTVDGDKENGVEFNNFNAAGADVHFKGFPIHPGDGKNKMINASFAAMEFNNLLPAGETPRGTSGFEGFFHLTDMSGNVESADLKYLIRDHDEDNFEKRKKMMMDAKDIINDKYGEGTCILKIEDEYRNMVNVINDNRFLIDNAYKAIKDAGLEPESVPVRGGTDGARLSFMGLPCPNLGTGGYAFHGPYEHITAEAMDSVVRILHGIVKYSR